MNSTLLSIMLFTAIIVIVASVAAEKTYKRPVEIVCYVIIALSVVVFLGSSVLLIISSDAINKETADLTEITAYYEYANENEYEVVAEEDINDSCTIWCTKKLYTDYFGKVFIITCEVKGTFEYEVTKTEVKSSNPDKKIIPRYPEDYHGSYPCRCIKDTCSCTDIVPQTPLGH